MCLIIKEEAHKCKLPQRQDLKVLNRHMKRNCQYLAHEYSEAHEYNGAHESPMACNNIITWPTNQTK
jgi:hypothetical protein